MTTTNFHSSEQFSIPAVTDNQAQHVNSHVFADASSGMYILGPHRGADNSQTLIDQKILPPTEIHNGSQHDAPHIDTGIKVNDLHLHFALPKTPGVAPGEGHKVSHGGAGENLQGVGKLDLKNAKPNDNVCDNVILQVTGACPLQ